MPITLKDLLTLDCNYRQLVEIVHHQNRQPLKVIRHTMNAPGWEGFDDLLRFDKHLLKLFTAAQVRPTFQPNELLIVCVANPGKSALLRGVFMCEQQLNRDEFATQYGEGNPYWKFLRNNNIPDQTPGFFYHLKESHIVSELYDRLVIEWNNPQQWIQRDVEKKILEIRPAGFVSLFPGWERVLLTHQELKEIIKNEEGNRSWYDFLSNHLGVYTILDTQSKQLYIGSATGSGGIWQRWAAYANDGHGGNEGLIELLDGDSSRANDFRYSINHVFARGTLEATVRTYEGLVKKKLMSSLNRN